MRQIDYEISNAEDTGEMLKALIKESPKKHFYTVANKYFEEKGMLSENLYDCIHVDYHDTFRGARNPAFGREREWSS